MTRSGDDTNTTWRICYKGKKGANTRKIPTAGENFTKDRETERKETMTIKLQRPTEAFAALAWVVCTADKLGSVEERDFLYEQVRNLEIFKGHDRIEFQYLLGATFIKVFQTHPGGESSLTEQGVDSLIQAVNATLSPELRVEAFRMAIGLARADELCDAEEALLEQLRRGLEIDDTVAQDILVHL
jgi:hypothetical protein